MDQGQFLRITEGQRVCLRLVFLHKTSKDIARELDISPHTVDQRLRSAIRTLGVTNRVEAARALAAFERGGTYQPTVYQSPDIELTSTPAELAPPARVALGGGEGQESLINSPRRWHPPFATYRGERNDLGVLQRLFWIFVIAVSTALSFGALLAGLQALTKLL
jgi:DNA-binding CsgD family transcriptional regulator